MRWRSGRRACARIAAEHVRRARELNAQRRAPPAQARRGRHGQCRAVRERDGAAVHALQLVPQQARLAVSAAGRARGDAAGAASSWELDVGVPDGCSRPTKWGRRAPTRQAARRAIASLLLLVVVRLRGACVAARTSGGRQRPQSCRSVSYGWRRSCSRSVRTVRVAAPSRLVARLLVGPSDDGRSVSGCRTNGIPGGAFPRKPPAHLPAEPAATRS